MHRTAWFPSALSARPCVYHREFLSEPRQLQHTFKAILARNQMKEPLIGSDRCIFTFYDQPSSKQLPCWRLSETLNTGLFTHKYTHKHTRTHTQTDKDISGKQEKGIEPLFFCQYSTVIPRTKGHCQPHLFASH